jgi:CheY-like chemotaxis protein
MNCAQFSRDGTRLNSQIDSPGADGNRKSTNGLTALVVDDNPGALKLAAAMLKKLGFEVRTASEGAEAIFHFANSPCDLLLTDYEMPAINGYQLGRKIKSQDPGTRVVVMTGLSRAAVIGLMSDQGIDGWLFKPFYLEELKTLLERVGLSVSTAAESPSTAYTLKRMS